MIPEKTKEAAGDYYISHEATILALLDKGQRSRRYKIGEIWELNFDEIREAVETIPAADVVEVVRCGECIFRTSGYPSCQGRPKDWFCANGYGRNK